MACRESILRTKKIKRPFGFLVLGLLGALMTAYWWINVYPNFHTVVDGELYRSAQLSPSQLKEYVSENAIVQRD